MEGPCLYEYHIYIFMKKGHDFESLHNSNRLADDVEGEVGGRRIDGVVSILDTYPVNLYPAAMGGMVVEGLCDG